jgi:bacillithiol biosynthesis deacetylase BshB1
MEIRREEAECAAGVLGLATRLNLDLPDGGLRDTDEARRQVVHVLRTLRPRVVVAPPLDDHHTDHRAAAEILSRCLYLSGVAKYGDGGEPWRPHVLLHTLGTLPAVPDLIVDISAVYELRQRAIACYRSQFFRDGAEDGPPTRISHPDFLDSLDGTCRYFGSLIGVARGEAFTSTLPVPVQDPVSQYSTEPWKFPPISRPESGST